jgi:hypothetical protein
MGRPGDAFKRTWLRVLWVVSRIVQRSLLVTSSVRGAFMLSSWFLSCCFCVVFHVVFVLLRVVRSDVQQPFNGPINFVTHGQALGI